MTVRCNDCGQPCEWSYTWTIRGLCPDCRSPETQASDSESPPFRDGKIHVCAEMCETCVFRPGNLMSLQRGRVRGMVDGAKEQESAITCHKTLNGEEAVCRGFFDLHATRPLQIAERLDLIEFIDPPKGA